MRNLVLLILALLLASTAARQLQQDVIMDAPATHNDSAIIVTDVCYPGACGRSLKCCELVDAFQCVHKTEPCPSVPALESKPHMPAFESKTTKHRKKGKKIFGAEEETP